MQILHSVDLLSFGTWTTGRAQYNTTNQIKKPWPAAFSFFRFRITTHYIIIIIYNYRIISGLTILPFIFFVLFGFFSSFRTYFFLVILSFCPPQFWLMLVIWSFTTHIQLRLRFCPLFFPLSMIFWSFRTYNYLNGFTYLSFFLLASSDFA